MIHFLHDSEVSRWRSETIGGANIFLMPFTKMKREAHETISQ